MKDNELILLDTNVLVYSVDEDSAFYELSRNILHLASSTHQFFVTSQVLAEFVAVITSPKRVQATRSSHEAIACIESFLDIPLILLPVPADLVTRWIELIRKYRYIGPRVFDLQLIANMLGNGIDRICSFNISDFDKIDEVQLIRPQTVAGEYR